MLDIVVFHTKLGWMGMIGEGPVLKQLTFGHRSAEAALNALDPELRHAARSGKWNPELVARLKAYAEGAPDDFTDVPLDPATRSPFRRRVLDCCRQIPYGETLTYGQLATVAGYPGAARAVGNTMATNCIPLVIPCHRVVPSAGPYGGYSAASGTAMKRRLLAMEAAGRPAASTTAD
jgi:methylated-DNA-[protein]-cysteine S-methyltransferase